MLSALRRAQASRWLSQSHAACQQWARWYARRDREAEIDPLLPVVAIVGRPNVGKSALFNRLARRRAALVADTPGGHVTRDYQAAPASLADLKFVAVDTSGLEPEWAAGGGGKAARRAAAGGEAIQARAAALTARVLSKAHAALLLFDGRTGVLPADEQLARWVRAAGAPPLSRVVLVANKCERRGPAGESGVAAALAEAVRLGLGEPVAVSAETGEGMADLYAALQPLVDGARQAQQVGTPAQPAAEGTAAEGADEEAARRGEGSGPVRIAIMGLPNVGKSTLTNRLLREERCLTGPEPGLTRDAITARLDFGGRELQLVDTAGWARRAAQAALDDAGGAVAAAAAREARAALRFAHVVALVVDAPRAVQLGRGLTAAELALASAALAEGRVLLVAANKLDALPSARARSEALNLVQAAAARAAPGAGAAPPVLGLSALTGAGAEELLGAALEAYGLWNARVGTAQLNRWLEKAAAEYAHTGGGGQLRRIKFLAQERTRPPAFAASVSGSAEFDQPTRRLLAGLLRRRWGLGGVPMRLLVRHRSRRRRPAQ